MMLVSTQLAQSQLVRPAGAAAASLGAFAGRRRRNH